MSTKTAISLVADKKAELRKLLFMCSQIKKGFYASNGYLLTINDYLYPYNFKKVVFPQEYINAIKADNNFWNKIGERRYLDDSTELSLSEFVQFSDKLRKPEINSRTNVKDLAKVANLLEKYFGHRIKELKISYTTCGTGSSYFTKFTTNVLVIHLYPRYECFDLGLKHMLVHAYIHAIYPNKTYKEYKALTDFVYKKLKFERSVTDQESYSHQSNEVLANMASASEKIYSELGFFSGSTLTSENGAIVLDGFGNISFLTKKETIVLDKLISMKGEVVSYDSLYDLLWPNNDSYSYSSISKIVERIRQKFVQNGANGFFIKTHRGRGYSYLAKSTFA